MTPHQHLHVLAASLILAAGVAPGLARAQPAPTTTETEEARRHFDRGVRLFDQGDNDGALVEFRRAWELSRRPSVLFNVAAAAQALRRYGEAVEALRLFLVEVPGAHPQRPEAEHTLRELEQLLARVRSTATVSGTRGATWWWDRAPTGLR